MIKRVVISNTRRKIKREREKFGLKLVNKHNSSGVELFFLLVRYTTGTETKLLLYARRNPR